MAVDARDAAESRGDLAHHRLHAIGERAAVGVAERDPLGAGADRRVEAAQRVVGVAVVPVEEVLGVVAPRAGRGRRTSATESPIIARFSSVVVRSTSTTWRSHALPTSVMIGAIESSSVRSCRSSCGRMPGRRVAPNAARVALRSGWVSHRREELGVGRIGAGPSALDDADTERVEVLGDAQLVGHREVDADALRTVAQRGVVDLDAHEAAPLRAPRWRNASRATASATASVLAVAAEVGGEHVLGDADVDGGLDRHGEVVAMQRVAQQHRDREDGAVRVGDAPARECSARCRGSARTTPGRCAPRLADGSSPSEPASTAASSLRMSPKRFSVTTTSTVARLAHQAHRERVDELVRQRDVGIVGRKPAHDLAPELAGDQHVGLVDRDELAAPRLRELERDPRDPLDLRCAVHDAVAGDLVGSAAGPARGWPK